MTTTRQAMTDAAMGALAALAVLAALVFGFDAFGQDLTAGPPPTGAAALIDNPLGSFANFFGAVRDGQYWLAGMFALFFLVGGIRTAGKKIHGLIPDDTAHPLLRPVERVLFFIFDTKIGGWLLNWTTAISGCLAMAYMAGAPVDGAAWKSAILISTSATSLVHLKGDISEWWQARKSVTVPAPTAPGGTP